MECVASLVSDRRGEREVHTNGGNGWVAVEKGRGGGMDLFGDDESDGGSAEAVPVPVQASAGKGRLKKGGVRVWGEGGKGDVAERKETLKSLAKKRAAEEEAAEARKRKRVSGGGGSSKRAGRSSRGAGEGNGGEEEEEEEDGGERAEEARLAAAAFAAADEAQPSRKKVEMKGAAKGGKAKGKGKGSASATVEEVTKDIFGEDDEDGDSGSDLELEPEDVALLDDTELVREDDGDFEEGLIGDDDGDGGGAHGASSAGKGKGAVQGESEFDKYFTSRRVRKVQRSHEEVKEEVVNFITRMDLAADADVEANRKGRPCVSKLKMCREVLVVMRKRGLGFILLDEGVLSVLSNWLALMPDGSLPSAKVRSTVLEALVGFHIPVDSEEERAVIKKSGIAGRVMLLTKIPEESEARKTTAHELLKRWSRPIFKKNVDYMDAAREERARTTVDSTAFGKARPSVPLNHQDRPPVAPRASEKHSLFKKGIAAASGGDGAPTQTRMPAPLSLDYSVRPDNTIVHGSSLSESQRDAMRSELKTGMAAKMSNKMRTIRQSKTKARNAQQVSIEGRGMYT